MTFNTAFNRPTGQPSATGDGTEIEYEYHIMEDGSKQLVAKGTKNVYEMVQSSLEETKIENIIKRAAYDPDTLGQSWAVQSEGATIDLTDVPENYHEMRQRVLATQQMYDKLPANIKEKFDNDVGKFINEYGTKSWLEKCGLKNNPETKEVTVNEPEQ